MTAENLNPKIFSGTFNKTSSNKKLLPTFGTERSTYWKTTVHKSDSEEISEETV